MERRASTHGLPAAPPTTTPRPTHRDRETVDSNGTGLAQVDEPFLRISYAKQIYEEQDSFFHDPLPQGTTLVLQPSVTNVLEGRTLHPIT
jgi:hypothetical protein